MPFRSLYPSRFLLALFLCLVLPVSALAADKLPTRVIAIGDVHGDHGALVQLLQRSQLLDAQARWSGGDAVLVQTGDLVDRGPEVKQVLDLLMALEEQAQDSGGKVISLLGNHEVMNVTGDLRYVTPGIYASFAGPDAEKLRAKAWKRYGDWARRRAKRFKEPEPDLGDSARQQWMDAHPPGYFEYLDAFSARGRYGKWIRKRDTLAKLGGIVFLHGGIDPEVAKFGLDGINRRVRDEMARYDTLRELLVSEGVGLPFFTMQELSAAANKELQARKAAGVSADKTQMLEEFLNIGSWLSINPDGPLWFRGFARWDEEPGAQNIDHLLKAFDATHFVVGHSPLADGRIRSRFGGRVFLIDTGMLTSYYKNGRASALEISGGTFNPIYADAPAQEPASRPRDAAEAPAPRLVKASLQSPAAPLEAGATLAPSVPQRAWKDVDGKALPFKSDAEILEFMETAKVVEMKTLPDGITSPQRVLLEKDGIRAHAVFRTIDVEKMNYNTGVSVDMLFRDTYIFEPAAYRLALLLGLDNVPPATVRTLAGKPGSLQLFVEGVFTETSRRKRNLTAPNNQYWAKQMQTMHLFDVLIYNMDRNSGNILIDDQWKVWFIDHTRAFRRYEDLKDAKRVQYCERRLLERLKRLDLEQMKAVLSPYLRQNEMKAILKRRDKLVRHLEQLIAKKGENTVLFDWEPSEMQAASALPE